VKAGYGQDRLPALTGGGLIRNLGGSADLKKLRSVDQHRIKGEKRIIDDSDIQRRLELR
jgi:hypothetical protein